MVRRSAGAFLALDAETKETNRLRPPAGWRAHRRRSGAAKGAE
jgi:hypothetical protein